LKCTSIRTDRSARRSIIDGVDRRPHAASSRDARTQTRTMLHDVSLAHPIRMKFAAQVGWCFAPSFDLIEKLDR